ncbi:MAG: Uma2 family endonuclease [Limisphaerales bacterium]
MSALLQPASIPEDEYLTGEELSEVRHEYIGGCVYAMAGTSDEHGTIVGNAFSALRAHIRGRGCRALVADMKVRLELRDEVIHYYPDAFVTCDPRDTERYLKQHPRVVIEVLSFSTKRLHRREKFWNYQQIGSLEEYVLVASNHREATVFRRANGWRPEVFTRPEEELHLASLDFRMPLTAVYEDLEVPPIRPAWPDR